MTLLEASAGTDRDQQLRGVRALAEEALAAFGLPGADLALLEVKQNATFRVDRRAEGGPERFLLRLCMPGRYGEATLRSELLWLRWLRGSGVAVPEPVPARDGSLVPLLAVAGVEPRFAVLFRWLPGLPLERGLATGLAESAGRVLGRLHRLALEFRPPAGFERPRWDLARLIGDPEVLPADRLPADAGRLLSSRDRAFLEEAGRVVRAEIGLLAEGPEAWGLIHTDLEPDNLIVDGGELHPIDFEHCGWGWFLYDVAASLLPMADKPGFPVLRQEFVRGYESERQLPPGHTAKLDLFLVARCLFSLRLIFLEAWDHPALRQEAVSLVPYMLGGIRRILAQRADAAPAALSVVQLLARLRDLGIRLWEEEGALRFSAPKGALDAPLKAELSARKGEILAFLQQAGRRAAEAPPPIPRVPRDGPLPVSFPQRRLWLIDQLEPGTPAYNLPVAFRLEGAIDAALLRRVLDEIVRRHEVLRTTFAAGPGDDPVQRIAPARRQALPLVDLRSLLLSTREAEARRLAGEDTVRGYDLAAGPLLRTTLVQLGEADSVLITNMHHIISDGWSGGIFVREVGALYEGFLRGVPPLLPELPVQYADFAAWQRGWLQGQVLEGQIAYWKRRLAGAPALLELPTDRPRPSVQSHHGLGRTVRLPRALTEELKGLAQREGATLFMLLLAGFAAQLARLSGQESVVIGSPTAGRSRPELEGLIGFFVNMLVLRSDLDGNPTFRELLVQVRRTTLEAFQHQDLSFEQLVEELAPQRNLSYSPIFQVTFAFQNAPGSALRMPGVVLRRLAGSRSATPFDLALSLEEGPQGLEGSLRARRDLFDAATLERVMDRYAVLLAGAAAEPGLRLADLPLLTEAERHELVWEWNDTAAAYPAGVCVHQRFEEQASRHPGRIALIYEGEGLSYGEMEARANRLAWYLRDLGVGPEVVVGAHLERSLDLVVALHAILKAGGCYLPLDPGLPRERLGWMLADSGARVVLSSGRPAEELPGGGFQVVRLDELGGELERRPAGRPPFSGGGDHLAYVIFTSGSTGRPKGVMCHHRGLFNRLVWMQESFPIGPGDRLLQKTPFSFDVSVWELFWPFMYGASLVVARPGGHQDSAYLVDTMAGEGISVVHFVPSMLRVFLEEEGVERCAGLRRVFASGEALAPELAAGFFDRLGAELVNLYGPTEAAIDVSSWVCRPGEARLPIGRPIANLALHVLDASLRPAPLGVPGELLIGGVGVARGYLGRPELTAERFIPDGSSATAGSRLYRTGDLARWLPDGAIEYLGRLDHQVKIRGFRIELGEIEAVLNGSPAVRECVVVAREDGPGSARLVAYVVPASPGGLEVPSLLEHLAASLPAYMVPSVLVPLERLPLNASGKVDRRALPALPAVAAPRSAGEGAAPRTPLEELVAGVWSEVLGVGRVAVEASFFDLGGHSLQATRVVSRLRKLLGVQLALRVLFEAPTVAGLARRIETAEHGAAVPIPRADRSRPLPLSFAQERLWFLAQLEPDSASYNMPAVVRLRGRLAPPALAAAFGEIVRRHEVLRTVFSQDGETPVQTIRAAVPFVLPLVDLSALPAAAGEAEALRLAVEEAGRPFDLAAGPLLRVSLLRLAPEEHGVLADLHHIVSDGWSIGILLRELADLYTAFASGVSSALPELAVQYADFAAWQREWLRGEVLAAQLAYWSRYLAGAPTVLDLPTDRPRPAVSTPRGGSVALRLPASLTAALHALARREGATLFMALAGLFQAFLARHTGQRDVLVGSPVANRHRAELEPLIGFFVNTLVLRGDLSDAPDVRALLARAREGALAAYAHQDLPFEKLIEALAPARDLSRSPLFQVMLVLQNAPRVEIELAGLTLREMPLLGGAAKFDLTLSLAEGGEALGGRIDYRADLFDGATVARLAGRFQTLLAGAVAEPGLRLADLPLLTEAERHELVWEWNDTAAAYPAGVCVHQRFEEQASRHPGRIALIYEGEGLSYGEMEARANRLAWYLRDLGVGPEVVVGAHLERSLDLVVALHAILKAGGCYLPLDPGLPRERLGWMLADSGARVVLSSGRPAEGLPGGGFQVVRLDELGGELERRPAGRPPFSGGGDHLAYVIFTSGSTGRPKGVMCHHRGLFNRLVWMQESFPIGPGDRLLQKTPFSFDVSVWELFWPFMYGASLVVARPGGHQDSAYLVDTMAGEGISVVHFVPSMLRVFLEEEGVERCAGLRRVFASGEALAPELAAGFFDRLGAELVNLYGPTEAAIDVSSWVCRPGEARLPIGRPIANLALHVLDASLRPAPLGVPGELLIGGVGVARGYLGRPELTAERFIPDGSSATAGSRLYRTGDLARWLPDGAIEYLGRLDHQVKIRGFRIELGEIEAVLNGSPAVRECVVVAREDGPGSARLVAYVVPASPGGLEVPSLLEHLAASLPAYMVPSVLVPLERLPLNASGKVDRRALPALPAVEAPRPAGEGAAPRTPLEELIAGVWSEVLGVGRVAVEASFFDLGGHSLQATRVVSRLRKLLGVQLALRVLFEAPTVAGLARRIETAEHGAAEPIPRADRSRPLPLSFAQERLWFLAQLEPDSASYNMPAVVRLRGRLAPPALAAAFSEIVRRHEVLRTVFSQDGETPVQTIRAAVPFVLPLVDLSALPAAAGEAEALRLAVEEAGRPFDLAAGPLLRVSLLRLAPEEHGVLADLHHIVSDGWSIGVLLRELADLYAAFASGVPSALPELAVQYADFAAWQREWLRGEVLAAQLAYWSRYLAGAPTVLDLPTDRPRPAVQSLRGGSRPVRLTAELASALHALGRRAGATMFMTLLSLFQALLGRHAGQEEVLVGSPIANRNRAEVEPLIGFFVNTLVLRGDLRGAPDLCELLARVRAGALGAYAHQDLPFERLVEELAPRRDLGLTPLFQAVFALQNAPMAAIALRDLTLETFGLPSRTAKFDLTLTLVEAAGGLEGALEHAADLFDAATVDRLVDRFLILAAAAAAEPERPVADLPLLAAQEVWQIAGEWGRGPRVATGGIRVHDLVTAWATTDPERPAVVSGVDGRVLTYGQLDRRANHLAWRLRELGVGPEVPVGLCLERSPEMVVATLAILKAGGAYVPLDPSYPRERLCLLIEDTATPVLVTAERWLSLLPHGAAKLFLAAEPEERGDPPRSGTTADSLAYVMYTSGSTGQPKGVAVVHRGIVRLVLGADFAELGKEEVLLQLAPFAFDAATLEIWGALARGGRLVVAPPQAPTLEELGELLARHRVTTLWLTAGLFHQMVDGNLAGLASVRQLLAGGDVLSVPHVQRVLAAFPDLRLVNGYGPTENTTFTSCQRIRADDDLRTSVPLGRPIAGTRVEVLDGRGGRVPAGVPGELHAGGAGLARGYFGRPDLTAQRFVPDPFAEEPGERLYRTGDRVRFRADGRLEFLGRIDHQVKIRGFRVELGEVEAAIAGHSGVRDTVVTALEGAAGRRLVAYVVPREPGADAPLLAQVRARLRETLPEPMQPSAWVVLPGLPLDPNGKVDRRALPSPEAGRVTEDLASPRTPMEELLAGVWAEVLGLAGIGREESFFDLGGHSLLATQVVSRLRQLLGVQLPLRALFEAPTLAELARRLDGEARGAATAIPRADRDRPLPLSFAQERLWFLDQLEPGARYNVPAVLGLEGNLDLPVLAAVFEEIVRRHESLRTTFAAAAEGPVQVIAPPCRRTLPLADLGGLPAAAREAEALRVATAETLRPFDLAAGPLLRVGLLRLSAVDHLLVLTMHHIVSDGWSVGVMIRELALLYAAFAAGHPSPLPELPIQYPDFAAWQRGWLRGAVLETQIAYWRERLAGAPTVLDLPADRPRPAAASGRGGGAPLRLGPELTAALETLCRREGATPFIALLAIFQLFLGRHAGVTDLLVGSPIANRQRSEVEPLVGFFVNTMVLRGELAGGPTVRELLGRARETALGAYAHQDLPFERLVEELAPRRDLSRTPLFQVLFVLQNAPSAPLELPGLRPRAVALPGGAAKLDLALTLQTAGDELAGGFDFSADLFDAATVQRFAGRFRVLLAAAVADPERPAADLPLFAAAERHQLAAEWNDTPELSVAEIPVHQRIAERAESTPTRIALAFEGEELTYAGMMTRARRLAGYLRELGVRPGVVVGVHLERSLDLVVALLAVLEAGGAYLPLEPAYPAERLGWMLADSGAPVVLSDGRLAPPLPAGAARVVRLDEIADELESRPAVRPVPGAGLDDLAYVIYTSGSTGRPKGVLCHHRGLSNRLRWMEEAWPTLEDDRFLQKTPFSFDVSVWEIFAPLAAGARLVIARPAGHQDSSYLVETLATEGITWAHFVPSMLRVFLEESGVQRCRALRRVSASGEALPPDLVARFHARLPGVELLNLYGPTEAAIEVTAWACRPGERRRSVPIGRPIAGTAIHLIDPGLHRVPAGVSGELLIGGVGVARGYLGRPELTAERFIPDPWASSPGARLYRTGDLARWLPDGAVEYLGRLDHQVKVRGVRVELGEVEAVLAEQPLVRDCVVVAREERLIAYVVPAAAEVLDGASLLDALRGRLPAAMVPSSVVFLDRLPLNPNGKVDRGALPAASAARPAAAGTDLPRDRVELELVRVWEELLERPVGVREDFFALGGHSLLALRLLAGIERRLGVRLPVAALFRAPTVETLAEELRRSLGAAAPSPLVPLLAGDGLRPFFWVHAAAGNVFCYAPLARSLGGVHPIYGLEAPGFEGTEPPFDRVEALADRHLAVLREVQPRGPYRLGGWSFGGLVAFEMARRLEAAGEPVELLALVDSAAPPAAYDPAGDLLLSDLATFGRDLGIPPEPSLLAGEELSGLAEEEALTRLGEALLRAGLLPPGVDLSRLSELFAVFRAHLQAQRSYHPSSPWGGSALLFLAAERPAGESSSPAERWRELAAGGVEVVALEGDHHSILREPHVRTMAARLRDVMERHAGARSSRHGSRAEREITP